jgi:hypothetical protein
MVRLLLSFATLLIAARTAQQPGAAVVAKVHGRITEQQTGKPAAKLRVGLVRKSYSRDGVLEPSLHAAVETDEDGAYTIVATLPGRYYVTTAAQTSEGLVFVPRYFPGAPDITSAAILNLADGTELHDVNIAVARGKRVNVRGRFLDGLGRNLPHQDWVWLVPRHVLLQGAGQMPAQTWGGWRSGYQNAKRYEITGVPPGQYYLMSWRFDDIQNRGESVIPIEVGDTDLEVDVVSYRAYRLNGRFRFEDGSSFSMLQRTARGPVLELLARATDSSPVMNPRATLYESRLLSFGPLPAGTYRLSILGVPAPFYVQSAKFGRGPNVLDGSVALPNNSADSLEIVVASNGGQLRGTVRQGAGSSVVLVPQDHPGLRPDLYKVVLADNDGAFAIGGIAPGTYRVYAWQSVTGNPFFDAEYMQARIAQGTPVTIAAGTVIEVDLSILQQ